MARRKQKDTSFENDFQEIEQMSKFIHQEKTKNLSFKIKTKFKNQKQKLMYDSILNNRITFIKGSPGTGKTFVALMTALECLKDKKINQIILTKPIIEVSKSLGFLKGTLEEKTEVYFNHFYDNINKIIGYEQAMYLKDSGFIKESILNFMRGITFDSVNETGKSLGAIVILDESQNTTIHEMKTFISRMGEDCKLIIMGDTEQSDIKLIKGEKNGLQDAIDRFVDMNNIGYVEFTDDDIVRDPFLIEIMKRYRM